MLNPKSISLIEISMQVINSLFFIGSINFVVVHGILGGKNVSISDAPYQVNYADKCGGVLIHNRWALTTAHCGDGTYIKVGSTHRLQGDKIQVLYHLIHPKYQEHHEFDFDVQLLKLFKSLHFGKLVNSVRICRGRCGKYVEVFGWGYPKEKGDYNDILQSIRIKVIPLKTCQEVAKPKYNHTLTSRMFCAEGEGMDACQGDSGGAAVSSGELVGLSSFGHGCGRDIPGVYTKVTDENIRRWISYYNTGV